MGSESGLGSGVFCEKTLRRRRKRETLRRGDGEEDVGDEGRKRFFIERPRLLPGLGSFTDICLMRSSSDGTGSRNHDRYGGIAMDSTKAHQIMQLSYTMSIGREEKEREREERKYKRKRKVGEMTRDETRQGNARAWWIQRKERKSGLVYSTRLAQERVYPV